jgi:predicted amidophosphoribosyltransferase
MGMACPYCGALTIEEHEYCPDCGGLLRPEKKCPYCGSKGKKKPHMRIMNTNIAINHGWFDTQCGSCKKPFKSYEKSR